MSHPASHSAPASSVEGITPVSPPSRFAALLTAIGAILLIGSEIWLTAVGTIWAADGYFKLGIFGDIILVVLVVPLALWATWMTIKLAVSVEMNPENAD